MDYRSFYEFEVGVQKIRMSGVQGIGLCPVHKDTKNDFHKYVKQHSDTIRENEITP